MEHAYVCMYMYVQLNLIKTKKTQNLFLQNYQIGDIQIPQLLLSEYIYITFCFWHLKNVQRTERNRYMYIVDWRGKKHP